MDLDAPDSRPPHQPPAPSQVPVRLPLLTASHRFLGADSAPLSRGDAPGLLGGARSWGRAQLLGGGIFLPFLGSELSGGRAPPGFFAWGVSGIFFLGRKRPRRRWREFVGTRRVALEMLRFLVCVRSLDSFVCPRAILFLQHSPDRAIGIGESAWTWLARCLAEEEFFDLGFSPRFLPNQGSCCCMLAARGSSFQGRLEPKNS
jgi:hypothetical protein